MTDLNTELKKLDKQMNEDLNNVKKKYEKRKVELKNKYTIEPVSGIYCKGPRNDLLNLRVQTLMCLFQKNRGRDPVSIDTPPPQSGVEREQACSISRVSVAVPL